MFVGQYGELCSYGGEMEAGNLLVEMLGEVIYLVLVFVGSFVLPKLQLGDDLVGKAVGHDE